jgi:hypothetical protein
MPWYTRQPRGASSANQAKEYRLNLIVKMMSQQQNITHLQKRLKCPVSGVSRLCFGRCRRFNRDDLLMKANTELGGHFPAVHSPRIGVPVKPMIDVQRHDRRQCFPLRKLG